VKNAKAAAALADPFRRHIVLTLVIREYSIAELSSVSGIEIRKLHYHVQALAALGLVKITGTRRRGGRPIKLYRASAPAYFVPAELQPVLPSIELGYEMDEALEAARTGRQEGLIFYVDEHNRRRMIPVATPGTIVNPASELWRVLNLSDRQAGSLLDEIKAVLSRYESRQGAPWLVRLALAPRKTPKAKR
jgi:DNA-binding transcriptional ArsR family regulator